MLLEQEIAEEFAALGGSLTTWWSEAAEVLWQEQLMAEVEDQDTAH